MTLSFCNDTKRSVNFDIFQNVLYDFKILEEKETKKIAVDLKQIADNLIKGKAPEVKELVQKALDEGIDVEKVLNEGLVAGMNVVGVKFKANEFYVPEVLIAARAMRNGMEILRPILAETKLFPREK